MNADRKWLIVGLTIFAVVIAGAFLLESHHKKAKQEYWDNMQKEQAATIQEEKHSIDNEVRALRGDIYMARAIEAEDKYKIVERYGDKAEMAEQAGKVASAYLDAHDEESYTKWKDIQSKLRAQIKEDADD